MTHLAVVERARGAGLPAVLAAVGVAVGYTTVVDARLALVLAALPLAVYVFLNPAFGLALAIALLPVLAPLFGAEGGAAVVSPSDALMVVVLAGLVPMWLLKREWSDRLRSLTPAVLFVAPYLGWLLVVFVAHFGGRSAFKTMTALEITVLPLVLGAAVIDRRHLTWALRGFVAVGVALAMLWILRSHGGFVGNKNTAGQYLAMGIILALVLAEGRLRGFAVVPILLCGLLFTASRGAIVAVAFGAVALLALRGLGSWRRTAGATALLSVTIVTGYNAIPVEIQARVAAILTANADDTDPNLSAAQESTNFNLKVRETYREDGYALVRANPILGVGAGNYLTGAGTPNQASDPHNFILRAAGEAGIPGAAAFLWMVGGTGLLLFRRLGRNVWAGPAIAIQVCSLVHGLVDVYFIRGIPVLGWFMVGLALNPRFDRESRDV